jgi:hypothetical protein
MGSRFSLVLETWSSIGIGFSGIRAVEEEDTSGQLSTVAMTLCSSDITPSCVDSADCLYSSRATTSVEALVKKSGSWLSVGALGVCTSL